MNTVMSRIRGRQACEPCNSQLSPRRIHEEAWLLRHVLKCGRCGVAVQVYTQMLYGSMVEAC
jgi:hypothetical protein